MTSALTAAQIATLRAAGRLTRHPGLQWRALDLEHRQSNTEAGLGELAFRYPIKLGTLQRMVREGLDNPSYRFHRDAAFYDHFVPWSAQLKGASWLDVGADSGCVDAYLADMTGSDRIELVDINVAAKSAYPVKQFDGQHLDYPDNSFDLVFFTYVLHHAADSTLGLLRDAHRIAAKHVIVLEDPKETAADLRWAYKHDPRGTFRGLREWRELFALTGFTVVHDAPLGADIHSRHFFVLAPDGQVASA